jgi:hypothetical protein
MSSFFRDRFDRVDGDIGSNYLIPCGGVELFDESISPVELDDAGASPVGLSGLTEEKTQALYNAEALDGPDQVVRGVWSHNIALPGQSGLDGLETVTSRDPSFTLIARMTKDPTLVDLGVAEQPFCYDQGYGLRVTCPRDGSFPILKFVKYVTNRIPTGYPAGFSVEPDNALVLGTTTLQRENLNLDPADTGSGNPLYRGFVQDMRLRVRRADNEVILEAFLNDRNLNTPVVTYTDQEHPLWGVIGLPGFEFLSARLTAQPDGVSPFGLSGEPLMLCHLFEVSTIKDFRRPVSVAPENRFTYRRVTNRVIELVEKNGDASYNLSTNGGTKFETYLQFVVEAEADIIRKEGYFHWLYRTQRVYLVDEQSTYEMPEDLGLIMQVRPGNWNNPPLQEMPPHLFRQRLAGVTQSGGRPTVFTMGEETVNNRRSIVTFPIPLTSSITTQNPDGSTSTDSAYFEVDYYARQLYPSEPDIQLPLVPQANIDVLTYGATAHALLLDTDEGNVTRFAGVYQSKLKDLRRENNRKDASFVSQFRSAADTFQGNTISRNPLTRATQLENLLI